MNNRLPITPLLCVCICIFCRLSPSARASIVANYQMKAGSTSSFDSFIKTNLIRAGQSSLGSALANTSALNGTFLSTGLNDGSATANSNMTYFAVVDAGGTVMPNTATFELTAGYNITNIEVISAWGDHNLGEQRFQLLLSINGGAFASYGMFTNNSYVTAGAAGSGAWMTTVTNNGADAIATNVTGVQFVFMNPDTTTGAASVGNSQAGNGSQGGTVIRELQVFGTYYTNLSASTANIPATNTNLLSGLTLNDWVVGTSYISSTVEGASLNIGFTGTAHVAMQVDVSQFAGVVAARYPVIAWSVNGGAYQNHQLASTDSSVLLSSGVTNPVIDLYIEGMSPFEDRYDGDVPPNAVKINGFLIDTNGSTAAVAFPSKLWLNIGDSILSGDLGLEATGQGRPSDDNWAAEDDGRSSYGYLLAKHYGYAETRIAYGGYDWAGGLANVPALTTLIDQKTSTISRLKNGFLNPIPDVVLINLGENGAPATSDVTNALFKLRSRVKPATKIIVMVPVAGTAEAQVVQAFKAYTNSSIDTNAYLVNLGPITYTTADGQHPNASGHQTIYQDALPAFDAIIKPAILQDTQLGTDMAAFDGDIGVNLIQAGQHSLAGESVTHGPSIPDLFATAGLNDGSAAATTNLAYYAANDSTGGNLPVTITFNLNTNIASGYEINSVEAITGWSDSNLANQNFQLLFSVNGGPFISCGAFLNTTDTISTNNGDNSILETLTSSSSRPIASGVTGVQFIFTTPGGDQAGSGGTLIRELQVFGTPIVNLTIQSLASGQVQIIWPLGALLQTTNLAGPWETNAAASSPYTVNPTEPATYYRVRVQ